MNQQSKTLLRRAILSRVSLLWIAPAALVSGLLSFGANASAVTSCPSGASAPTCGSVIASRMTTISNGGIGEGAGNETISLAGYSVWHVGDFVELQVLDHAGKPTVGFTNQPLATVPSSTGVTPVVAVQLGAVSTCIPSDKANSANSPTCDVVKLTFENNGTASPTGLTVDLTSIAYDLSTKAANGPVLFSETDHFAANFPGGTTDLNTGAAIDADVFAPVSFQPPSPHWFRW